MEPGAILKELNIRTLKELSVANRRVLVRADFNVPMDSEGRITDDTRLRGTLPTIEFIRKAEGRLILASHLGRPKGKKSPKDSLEAVARWLAEALAVDVLVPDDCVGDAAAHLVQNQRPGQVILLENLRYHAGEEENSEEFARKLADLCDVYVNDAFGTVHRAHASVVALPRLVPSRGAGLLLEREVEMLSRLVQSPEQPYFALLGGSKVSDKIEVIESLIPLVSGLVVGGAMACTFLAAQGHDMGKSKVEKDHEGLVRHLLERCAERGVLVLLPVDHVVVKVLAPDAPHRVVKNGAFEPDDMAVDIGPETIEVYCNALAGRTPGQTTAPRTVLWNGPMGVFEMDAFATGTTAVARAVGQSAAVSVIGGGDSAAAIKKAGVTPLVTHVSTGGGASLEFLSGRSMPGIQALRGGRR